MNSDLNTAQLFIKEGLQALKKGDRRSARDFAQKAAALAPQIEEPWLLLAYLATPKAAQYYLSQALQVNPGSPRALAAQDWLKDQSSQSAKSSDASLANPIAPATQNQPSVTNRRTGRLLVLLIALAVVAGLSIIGFTGRLAASQDPTQVKTSQNLQSSSPTLASTVTAIATWTTAPSETPTSTPTSTPPPPTSSPTETATTLPTDTSSPVPTETSTTTVEPTSTPKPSPTEVKNTPVSVSSNYKVQPGDTLSKIAQRYNISIQSLIAANTIPNPSYIYAGQVLTIPSGGVAPAAAVPAGPSGKKKEILIDISEQHLYAYEEGVLVFNYVVSTGTGNSTRLGTFKVLDKIPNAYSSIYNIVMPWWMGIYYSGTLENGIHGLPLLYNGVELWGNMLGRPATPGCIEARTSEIKKLYDWAEIGTTVTIRN